MKYKSAYFPMRVLTLSILLVFGCSKQVNRLDYSWTPPVKITDSIENLVGRVYLYKFRDAILCLQPLEKGASRCFSLTNNSWVEAHFANLPKGYGWGDVAMDHDGKVVMLPSGYMENEQLIMKVLLATFSERGLQNVVEAKWATEKKTFFGETASNVQLKHGLDFESGITSDSDILIPYCVNGQTYHGKTVYDDEGPFNNGVFHSTDSGRTWHIERISDFEASVPEICRTENYYYYFARRIKGGYELWFSCKPVSGGAWTAPRTIAKSFATTNERYVSIAEGDEVHVCWMDCRDDMRRFNMEGPNIENDDIVYRHRKDSDKDWSKDVVLSKGLLYSYSPSISIEGNNVVVAWSGIRIADKNHTEYDPNDIYYATSKDGGNTWGVPLKVTDKAKDEIVSGKPQVMLLNGVIHLFYIQGILEKPEQLSPGLTRLKQSPWPIYYTQRPFPN